MGIEKLGLIQSSGYQVNPPFNPTLPTFVAFHGGNCNTGAGMSLAPGYNQIANVLTVTSYGPPYDIYGNMVIDYLYRMAPYYDQPIQTMGYSTGGMPAIDTAIYMNTQFSDVRYAVNRVTFFDAACRDYTANIKQYLASRVEDEPCWIENLYANYGKYYPETLNIQFPVPPASHGTPIEWYRSSIDFLNVYHNGIVAGAYVSVAGPGKNMNVTNPSAYYFKVTGGNTNGNPDFLAFYNQTSYPGRLPQPITLTGPKDGVIIGSEGAVLSCQTSANVVRYQLLFGSSPDKMNHLVSETTVPPSQLITQFPFNPTYWTIRAMDAYGTTIHADPIRIYQQSAHNPVENTSLGVTYPYIQLAIDNAKDGEIIVVQPGFYRENICLNGKNIILTSIESSNWNIVTSTVIQGREARPVVTLSGSETPACVIEGFTIEGGFASFPGGGGICGIGVTSLATIRNCIIQNNTTTDYGGGIAGCKGLISNCIIRNNTAKYGGGLSWCDGTIKNCLIVNNTATTAGNAIHRCNGQILNCTIVSDKNLGISQVDSCDGSFINCILYGQNNISTNFTGRVTYCCYPGVAAGTGNISFDPLFVNTAAGDYHLLPDSPCIDAGDPASDYSHEPWPNGSRIDMGAYGNTAEAALSSNVLIPLGFQIVNKTRVGRTSFEYQLAVTVSNPNSYDMTNVQMKLKDWDAAVLSVSDDSITIDTILSGATVTSTDTFTIVVDRSVPIVSGMLTWQLMYYTVASGDQVQQAQMSMLLSDIDAGVPGDITGDGKVNLEDLAVMSAQWNTVPGNPSADIVPDGHVWIEDLMYLAENWLN